MTIAAYDEQSEDDRQTARELSPTGRYNPDLMTRT
jgi:hypothetical protein